MKLLIRLTAITTLQIFSGNCSAKELKFNPAFLSNVGNSEVDLSWVTNKNSLPIGTYNLIIKVNGSYSFTGDVKFIKLKKTTVPVFTVAQFKSMGVELDNDEIKHSGNKASFKLEDINKDFSYKIDQRTMSLDISIPQKYMKEMPQGFVNPNRWDEGISAMWINYDINGSGSRYDGADKQLSKQLFVNLNSGLNVGSWRFRDNSTWSEQNKKTTHIQSWAGRDIKSIRSKIIIGDSYTPSEIFDSYSLRGTIISSSDSMLSPSQSGYAPEVSGIAKTNATIIIKQNGYIIYQKTVPPGPFLINDLYPTPSGGDIYVTIKESDGTTQNFMVPFASVPNMVRKRQVKYMLGLGSVRATGNQESTSVIQGQIYYGLMDEITSYSGFQLSSDYKAFSLGIAHNLGVLGAYSLDIINALSTLADEKDYRGQSLRFRYSKMLSAYGTRFNFYSWRYSTKGFYSLKETTLKDMVNKNIENRYDDSGRLYYDAGSSYNLQRRKKSQNQVMLSQSLDEFGAISLSWNNQNFWNAPDKEETLQFSWNNNFKTVSLGVNLQRINNSYNKTDDMISVSVSIPFGKISNSNRVSYNMMSYANKSEHQIGVNGYIPGFNNMYYDVSKRYSNSKSNGGGATLRYQGDIGDYNLGYNYSTNSRELSYGASGGLVFHQGGVTLSQPLGNTNILISAPHAGNVVVRNQRGIRTDANGFAVVPYATPYRVNRVALDVTTVADDVELNGAVGNTVPTDGALTLVKIRTLVGNKIMFVMKKSGKYLPFGTTVLYKGDNEDRTSLVGDEGMAYMSGMPSSGILYASWGKENAKNCKSYYNVKDAGKINAQTKLYTIELECK